MTPLWRQAYDAIERPLAAGSESWIQSETFMDFAAVAFKLQQRLLHEVQRASEQWLGVWGFVSHSDLVELMNQVASLEREVRELRREAEQRSSHPLIRPAQTRTAA
jgi:predicted Zn-dependent protease